MALQTDIQHIGDSQNPNWIGNNSLQGLFINALAGQYGQFTADATFRNTINQNVAYSFEVIQKGEFALTNRNVLGDTKFMFFNINTTYLIYASMIYVIIPTTDRRTGKFINIPNRAKTTHSFITYDGSRISNTAYNSSTNGVLLPMLNGSGNPDLINTDTLYDNNNFKLGVNGLDVTSKSTIVQSLRFYDLEVSEDNFRKNYHNLAITTVTPFCEWKMAELSDFYTFGGGLYARNTGSSGNGLDNGTGYDMQLFGYLGNVPILTSIY